MDESKLASAMYRRKSVRTYTPNPLEPAVLDSVLSFAERAVPLFPDQKIAFRILDRSGIRSACSAYAPHFLAVFAERTPEGDLNSGFMVQQVDLYLSSIGLGSCWLGMAGTVEPFWKDLPSVILLAFGNPGEPVHRERKDQYRRKPLSEISSPGVVPQYMKAIRVAPSAMNKQPWFFSGDENLCRAFSARGKGLVNLSGSWRFVDLGIALCHLYIAAVADGRTVSFRREDSSPHDRSLEYMISCRLGPSVVR
jgi:hypothetical protein